MKTPMTYYGGKQKLVSTILPLFPEHDLYTEPFAGGAALFFAKEPSDIEVLNDLNAELINFYKVMQQDFISLQKKINITLHSRKQHEDARVMFTEEYAIRLQNVQLECADALYIIKSRDHARAFHYQDPPYYNSDCGHYGGYTEQHFESLLQLNAEIKGKFLLSSYPSDILTEYVNSNGWYQKFIEQRVSVNKGSGKKKVEVLTANYPI